MYSTIENKYDLTALELREMQLVQLNMLQEVDRICKSNNIKYCIIAGTLLGAVRHSGFIPWDDDLDVAMLRAEYEKFKEVCRYDLNLKKYFFQDNTTDSEYRWGYGKLRREGSEFIRAGQEHLKYHTGIFIDIFPLDCVPDNLFLRKIHNLQCTIIRKLLWSSVGRQIDKNPFIRLIYHILSYIPLSAIFFMHKSLAKYWNNKHTNWVRILTFPTPDNGFFGYKRKWYEDLADIQFEGYEFPAAKDYDEYLTFKFGDYMTMPPNEQRKTHPCSKFKLPED